MVGLAITVKQTAAFEAMALLAIIVWKVRTWRTIAAFLIASAVPTLGFVVYFVAVGHFNDAVSAVITLAGLRSQANMSQAPAAWYLDALARLGHYPALIKPLLVVTCGAALALLRRKRLNAAFALPIVDLTLIWYAAAVAGMLVVRSPEAWYAAPLIAPSLVLFVTVLCHGIEFAPRARPLWTAGFIAVAVVQPLVIAAPSLLGQSYLGPPDWRGNEGTAQGLIAAGLRPDDNLLVLSRGQYVYLLTGALPRARYFNAMHLLCRFPTPDADPLGAAFATRPKFVVMSDDSLALSCAQERQLLRIRDVLARDYVHLTTVTGAWDHFASVSGLNNFLQHALRRAETAVPGGQARAFEGARSKEIVLAAMSGEIKKTAVLMSPEALAKGDGEQAYAEAQKQKSIAAAMSGEIKTAVSCRPKLLERGMGGKTAPKAQEQEIVLAAMSGEIKTAVLMSPEALAKGDGGQACAEGARARNRACRNVG